MEDEETPVPIPNTCTLCQHTFPDSDQLAVHFRSFHPEVKFCCYECHLAFGKTEQLFNHMRIHIELEFETLPSSTIFP